MLLMEDHADTILGPAGGVLADVVDTLAASVAGSQRFPEDAYPFQAPGPTDQRGTFSATSRPAFSD